MGDRGGPWRVERIEAGPTIQHVKVTLVRQQYPETGTYVIDTMELMMPNEDQPKLRQQFRVELVPLGDY